MKVNSTEVQNNFGKYLVLAAEEEIVITRNGTEMAILTSAKERRNPPPLHESVLNETADPYFFKGKKASYQEFLKMTENVENRYEYIDGEIFLLASPKTAHQYAVSELLGLFYLYLQKKTCRPFVAPFDIQLKRVNQNHPNVVQPDLMVICDLEDHLNEEDYYVGVPSLVVEVLSISTKSKDMVRKLDLYMESGIKEYWIVNPFNKEIVIYSFENYEIGQSKTYKDGETAQSFLFNEFYVELNQIFKS